MSKLKRLVAEIHRRSLWQVLGIYGVSAWAIYQFVLALYEGIGLPDWLPGTTLALLAVFLPVVLATAFLQEGGPVSNPTRDSDASAPAHAADAPDASLDEAGGPAPGGSRGPGVIGDPNEPGGATRRGAGGYFTWNRAITAAVLAFALLGLATTGFMGMRYLGIGPAATLISSGELDERDPILLATFDVAARDTSLGTLVTEALRIDLSESPVIRLAARARVEGALERMLRAPGAPLDEETAREIAEREGLKAVLAGQVREAGGSYVLSARLVTPDSGRILAAFRETASDSAGLLPAIDRLSESIRSEVGESLKSVRSTEPLRRATTSSLDALRLYSQGRYTEAVAVDSTFAMAWRWLGVVWGDYGMNRSDQVEALTRAYGLRDRLGRRERLLTEDAYARHVLGDQALAEQAIEALLASHPGDPDAHNVVGIISARRGDWGAAVEHYRQAIESASRPVYHSNLAAARRALQRLTVERE